MVRYRSSFAMFMMVVLLGVSACAAPATDVAPSSGVLVEPERTTTNLEITGSSTVYPLTTRIIEEFYAAGSRAQIDIKFTGTGGGFRSFCAGDDIDMVNASRPISDNEIAACREQGREPVGFQVGIDALAIVVPQANTFLTGLTREQLAAIFTGAITRWNELDPAYPAEPIVVFSPGVDSGTFDYFVEELLDGASETLENLPGVLLSEDDTELVRGIEANPYAIGYFGYAYFLAERGLLQAVAIDGVTPNEASVVDGTYSLARPLFVYTSVNILRENATAASFINFYLEDVTALIGEVGYFPAPDSAIAAGREALQQAVASR